LAKDNEADIFATDLAVSAIMAAPKSHYSWDVKIKKIGGKVFIDKREDTNILDFLTLNETSTDQPLDDDSINGVRHLMEEDVNVNAAVLQSSLNMDSQLELSQENPFIENEGQVVTPVGYVYKLWTLGKGKRICIRCTVHNYVNKAGLILNNNDEEEKTEEEEKK
jgi:translation initiation factor 3 subunit D